MTAYAYMEERTYFYKEGAWLDSATLCPADISDLRYREVEEEIRYSIPSGAFVSDRAAAEKEWRRALLAEGMDMPAFLFGGWGLKTWDKYAPVPLREDYHQQAVGLRGCLLRSAAVLFSAAQSKPTFGAGPTLGEWLAANPTAEHDLRALPSWLRHPADAPTQLGGAIVFWLGLEGDWKFVGRMLDSLTI